MLHAIDPRGKMALIFNKVPFILQIIIGMIFGVILAYAVPQGQPFVTLLGSLFVSGLKAIAPLLVFVLVSASIARHTKGSNAKLKPILVLYVIAMCLSAGAGFSSSGRFSSADKLHHQGC